MNKKLFWALLLVALVSAVAVISVAAVSGAAFTTFNGAADGFSKDVCKNSAINCNIYGAKEYVWLNGGPTANGLGPDGQYFFAVLEPGGQPNPNDQGGALDKNLSDDYDLYTNRIFTVANGEVSAYGGTHDLDSGAAGNPKVDGKAPFIRLFPYADTTNPGGVYIMAICSLEDGYPVDPRDCKYDAFKVRKGKLPYQFMLSGMKFEDLYADGVKDATDPGLSGWKITIKGTGPDGQLIDVSVVTGVGGYWEWLSPEYWFTNSNPAQEVNLQVCEELPLNSDWHQSYPTPSCYTLKFMPVVPGFDSFYDLDFGNWLPVDVTACKVRDLDADPATTGDVVPVPGWMITLTENGEEVDTQPTGSDGCYTWTDLTPGIAYDLHEESMSGWEALGPTDVVFAKAKSNDSFSHTFVNAVLQGCTPGFWQGGSAGGQAGGQWLWNEVNDPQWTASGGWGTNPYIWTTPFSPFFTSYSPYLDNFDMMTLVGTGGGADDFQKAGRDVVAAYLNASWGMNYPYTPAQIAQMWADAVASGDFMSLHLTLDAANNSQADTDGNGQTEHQCPISANVQ